MLEKGPNSSSTWQNRSVIAVRMLGLLVGCGFCGAVSRNVVARLGLESSAARALAALVVFSAAQSLLILAAGLLGILSLWPLVGISAVGWAILSLPALRPGDLPSAPPRASGPPAPGKAVLLSFAALGLGGLIVKSFIYPPSTGDALSYHLPKIAQWVQSGAFVWGLNRDPRVWFSAGFELIETWWVVFLHHDALIEWGGLQMVLVAVSAVAVLAESFGASPWLAGVTYGFMPVFLLNATSCGNDLAVAAFVLSGYAFVACGAPRPLQALPLLLAIGVKATGAFGALGVAAFAWAAPRPARGPRGIGAAMAGVGALLAVFWYLRNWIVAGHPLYPLHGAHGEFSWIPQQGAVDLESLQQTLQVLPRRMVDPGPFESLARLQTGWGWGVLPLGVPLFLVALREDPRLRLLAGSFALGACSTLACVWYMDSNLRFVLWFPALFAIGLARQRSPAWLGPALAACLVNFVATLIPVEVGYADHVRTPAGLPRAAAVACVFRDQALTYRLYNHDFSRRVVYPRSLEELRRSGAKVVYLASDPGWAATIREWPRLGQDYYEIR